MTFRLLNREPEKVDLHTLQWAPANINAKIDVDENIVALTPDDFVDGIDGLKKTLYRRGPRTAVLDQERRQSFANSATRGVLAASFFCWDVPNWPKCSLWPSLLSRALYCAHLAA